jgi:outer membrane immunogenic protein
VFGIEAQGDRADLKGYNGSLTAIIPYTNQTKIDTVGLLTGQVGYAWNNVLWYVKGGAAFTDNQYSSFFTGTNIVFNQTNETRWGGVAGTGDRIRVCAELVGRRGIRSSVHGQQRRELSDVRYCGVA